MGAQVHDIPKMYTTFKLPGIIWFDPDPNLPYCVAGTVMHTGNTCESMAGVKLRPEFRD